MQGEISLVYKTTDLQSALNKSTIVTVLIKLVITIPLCVPEHLPILRCRLFRS